MKLSVAQRQTALLALTGLFMDGPECEYIGICGNLDTILQLPKECSYICGHKLVGHYSKTWEHSTGSPAFPVPGSFTTTPKWKGKQLEFRQSLIKHMIAMIKLDTTTAID